MGGDVPLISLAYSRPDLGVEDQAGGAGATLRQEAYNGVDIAG
jgi:hypothetical protein